MFSCMYPSCKFGFKYCSLMIDYICHACIWSITHCLCMLMFEFGRVYSGVMVFVVTHVVLVCVGDNGHAFMNIP